MEIKKIQLDNAFLDIEDTRNMLSEICNSFAKDCASRMDEIIVNALARKGFVFKTKQEIEFFLIKNGRCEDNKELQHRIYYINDIPFLLHNYKTEIQNPLDGSDGYKMKADLGSFAYL